MLKRLLCWFREPIEHSASLKVCVGDVGIYQDVIGHYIEKSLKDITKHDVFVKVKVLNVFKDLVEVEIVNIEISEDVHSCVESLAEISIGRYLNPKLVKWQIK